MNSAAGNGHLDIVKWLHSNRTEGIPKEAIEYATWGGHAEIIKYLRSIN